MKVFAIVFLIYLLIINIIAYILYGADKEKAKKSKWRIPEKVLIGIAWMGGSLGALLGMKHFHHKTLHTSFRILVPLSFIVWLFPMGSWAWVGATKSGKILVTPLMIRRANEHRPHNSPYQKHYNWVDYEDISPNLVRAVIASEDNLFPKHNGFSERGIKQAIKEKQESGQVRHGGSTISQQTAKNVFTRGKKTYLRKISETWFTLLIERCWGKQRIMEVYLNVAEWGDGIYGAEAASQQYFHHSAKQLSQSESALLAACLPSPRNYSVTNPGPYMRKRKQQILNLMPKMGKIELNND